MGNAIFGGDSREIKPYNKLKGITKPVLQMKDGVIIGRFESISEAGRRTNIMSSSIAAVCRGKNKSTGGFGWKYADYDMPVTEKVKVQKKITAIKPKVRKGPFKVIIIELCDTEENAQKLLGSLGKKFSSARIVQTRKRK